MDIQMIHVWLLALLFSSCCATHVSEAFTILSSAVSVYLGDTATLPCWLTSSQSAEDLEVRWYKEEDQRDYPILLYKAKALDSTSQQPSYAGRVSFGLKKETSGGLKTGDLSLNLENVTIKDAGEYTCFVSTFNVNTTATARLRVTEIGRSPLISAVVKENKVKVSCESEGWHPKPELHWSDRGKALTPADPLFKPNAAGLYSVRSSVLVSSSSEVSCSIGLSNEEPKEARMRLKKFQEEPGSSSAGWVAFGILLLAVLAAFGALFFLYFRKKANKSKSGNDTPDGVMGSPGENEALLPKVTWHSTALSEASKHYVNVQLMDTGNPLIKMKGSILRDAPVKFPDGDRVTCLTAVRGTPGFSSGQHYWEVSLVNLKGAHPKKSWWIGVTDKQEILSDESLSPTMTNGFCFLSSRPEQEHTVQLNTEPEVSISIQSRPKTVGVHLDYDNGELSFYNVEDQCLIGSLAAKFKGELFPLFNPGKGDISAMTVLQRPAQDHLNDAAPVEQLQNAEQDQSHKAEIESGTRKDNIEEQRPE